MNKLQDKTRNETNNSKIQKIDSHKYKLRDRSLPKVEWIKEDTLVLKNFKQVCQNKIISFSEFINEKSRNKFWSSVKARTFNKSYKQIMNLRQIKQPINVDLSDNKFTINLPRSKSRSTSSRSRWSVKDNEYFGPLEAKVCKRLRF